MDLPGTLSDATRDVIDRVKAALTAEPRVIAVMLTGPHAMGVDREEDKFYFVCINDDPEGVIEHRFLDRYLGVERQMEIGFFPRRFVEKLLADGYWDMVSLRAAEALRIALPLHDPSGYGSQASEGVSRHLPGRRFISGSIHRIKATYDDAVSLFSKGDHEGAVLVAREAVRLAAELVAKSFPQAGSGLDDIIKARLGEDAYSTLLDGLGIKSMTGDDLRQHVEALRTAAAGILNRLGINESDIPGG